MAQIGIPDINPKLEKDLLASMAEVEVLLRGSIEGKYPLVIETSRHLVDAGGKRLRPLLTLIASHFGDPKAKGIIEAAVVCELTHLGTLYHDDVMDEAPLRRGVESANNRWNNIMETQGSSTNKTALEHYLSVVSDKTASLISASARYGAMISGANEEIMDALTKFGEEIGTVFQLADDIIDIASDSKESGKTPGTDLREGVPTLVTLYILESDDPADAELKKLLSAPITDEAVVAQTILTLRNHSALTKSRELVAGYGRSAQKHLEILPEGPAKAALVGLSQAVISRTS